MPKYYCDYCDTFLTHDSPSVRKTHNGGRKHKENVRMYYQGWMEEQAQKLVDATTRAFTQGRMLNPGGLPGGIPNPAMMGPRGALPPMMRPPMPGMPFFPPQMAAMMARGAAPMPGAMPAMPGMPMPGVAGVLPPGMCPPMGLPGAVPPPVGGLMPRNGPPSAGM